jgi:hypothetical protein
MLALTTEQRDALESRHIIRRVFIWCESKDENGDPDPAGFWDDVGAVELSGRTYHGSGNLIQIGAVAARGDMTIAGITLSMSGIAVETAALVRASVIGQAPISVHIGLFDPETREIILPLLPHFSGYVDDVNINTPEAGGSSEIDIICESTSRALTKRRTESRSDANCRQRFPTDEFYAYTGLQREKPVYFGRNAPRSK